MNTIGDLKLRADAKLYEQSFGQALALYCHIVELQALNLDARLRIADSLIALGEVQSAALVYTKLAQHAALAGYPLKALVAIKILSALEPQLGELLREVGALYGRGSQRLGRGVRRAPPPLDQALPDDFSLEAAAQAVTAARAVELATSYDHPDVLYPDKLIPIPLLSLLDPDEFANVIGAIRLVRARPGAAIIEQGAPGRSFFVLARGSARVTRRDADGSEHVLATVHDGAIFGEMALLSAASRTASVHAVSDCDLLEFDREALERAAQTATSLTQALAGFAQERLLNNVMQTAAVFQPLDQKQRGDLMRRFVALDAAPGTQLIRQGEPGRGLYVILRGEVVVSRTEEGQTIELARLGAAEIFGEISLLGDEPTSATVTAVAPSVVLLLGKEYFARLVEAVPEIKERLQDLGEQRAMDTRISMTEVAPQPGASAHEEEIEVEILL